MTKSRKKEWVKKYVLHPGYVESKSDGDMHFIGATQLVKLYKIDMNEVAMIVYDCQIIEGDYIHLYPKYSGNYNIPIRSNV